MPTKHGMVAFAISAALFAGGCETATSTADPDPADPSIYRTLAHPDPRGIEGTKLVAHPENARPGTGRRPVESNVVLANRRQLMETLQAYAPGIRPGNLGTVIAEIEAQNLDNSASVPGLTGVGGVFGHALLRLAKGAVQGGNYNAGVRFVVDLSGQITDFMYDPSTESGTIEAITYVTVRRVNPAGMTLPNPDSIAYKFLVDVAEGGYTDILHTGDPDNPFPGTTLAFGPATLERIESLGFNRKLWAQGEDILVRTVWIDDTYQPGQAPNFGNPVDANDPTYARLFETDQESCIDMMFNVASGDPLPENMAELGAPPFYCLGRCGDPLLINTK